MCQCQMPFATDAPPTTMCLHLLQVEQCYAGPKEFVNNTEESLNRLKSETEHSSILLNLLILNICYGPVTTHKLQILPTTCNANLLLRDGN